MSCKTRYDKRSHLHGQMKKHRGSSRREKAPGEAVQTPTLSLQRWLKPIHIFRRTEIRADMREATATGTFRQPRSNASLGAVGESEHPTVAVWERGAGIQPGSLLGWAASVSFSCSLWVGMLLGVLGRAGRGCRAGGGMGYGGRIAGGAVHWDGFGGQRTVHKPVSWLLFCDRSVAPGL